MIVFAAWLGLCVYVGGLLEDGRAYGAVLSGYTVALVAVVQINSPQNIVLAGFNRGAAIVVGVAALALISEIFGAPNLHTNLLSKLTATHRRIIAFDLLSSVGRAPTRSSRQICCVRSLRFVLTSRPCGESGVVGATRGSP